MNGGTIFFSFMHRWENIILVCLFRIIDDYFATCSFEIFKFCLRCFLKTLIRMDSFLIFLSLRERHGMNFDTAAIMKFQHPCLSAPVVFISKITGVWNYFKMSTGKPKCLLTWEQSFHSTFRWIFTGDPVTCCRKKDHPLLRFQPRFDVCNLV